MGAPIERAGENEGSSVQPDGIFLPLFRGVDKKLRVCYPFPNNFIRSNARKGTEQQGSCRRELPSGARQHSPFLPITLSIPLKGFGRVGGNGFSPLQEGVLLDTAEGPPFQKAASRVVPRREFHPFVSSHRGEGIFLRGFFPAPPGTARPGLSAGASAHPPCGRAAAEKNEK